MLKLHKNIYNLSYINKFKTNNNNCIILYNSYSANKNRGKYAERFAKKLAMNANLPDFKALLRQFYKKAHPDLLRSSSIAASEVNNNSFQELNSVLTVIKGTDEYPPAMTKSIPFYIIDDNKSVNQHSLRLRTSGGDCKNQLTKCFVGFFQEIGILDRETFQWSDEYFQPLNVAIGKDNKQEDDIYY